MKRILFCTPAPLTKSLGAAKVVVELAEEMKHLGWDCKLLCPADVAASGDAQPMKSFHINLRNLLKAHAADYDVIDYDHEYLPYARSEFSPAPLFVTRSVLLVHHLETIPMPMRSGLKAKLGVIIKGRKRLQERRERICRAQSTVEAADLINVSNDDDKAELMKRGLDADKIIVIPYGISRSRRPLFDQISSIPPKQPVVAFVGTFDYRKGAREFPEIVDAVAKAIPDVSFKLVGTKGLYQTEAAIRSVFPKRLQKNLEIVLAYQPDELPTLLSSCSVGIFPSYIEGFGFGVLEMLAASVPVIAYDVPGPPMMLPPEYLVARGDWQILSKKTIDILQNENKLREARLWAKQQSQKFTWSEIAQVTQTVYLNRLDTYRGEVGSRDR